MKYYKNKETGEVLAKDSFEEIDGFISKDGFVMSYDDEAWGVHISSRGEHGLYGIVCAKYKNTRHMMFADIFKEKQAAVDFAEDLKERMYKNPIQITEK